MFASGRIVTGCLIAMLLGAGKADAASAVAKCQAAKLKIAAKYTLCNLNAQAKSVKAPVDGQLFDDLTKCTAKFDTKWAKAEEKGGADCPTSGDADTISSAVNRISGDFVLVVSPTRFVDDGDGTITDTRNGLMWEKKDGADGNANLDDVHDVDNKYRWSSSGSLRDGSLFTDFLSHLNNCSVAELGGAVSGGFAGHCDWRLPTQAELQGLYIVPFVNCGGVPPCIEAAFVPTSFDETEIPAYWTSLGFDPSRAVVVSFGPLFASASLLKTSSNWARAVRTIGGPFSAE